jgi:hypothetical protein
MVGTCHSNLSNLVVAGLIPLQLQISAPCIYLTYGMPYT